MHASGTHTGQALLREYIYQNQDRDGFDGKRIALEAKIRELLWPYKESHAMTYHPKYNTKVIPGLLATGTTGREKWGDIARLNEFADDQINSADAIDQAEGYYDVSQALIVLLRPWYFVLAA